MICQQNEGGIMEEQMENSGVNTASETAVEHPESGAANSLKSLKKDKKDYSQWFRVHMPFLFDWGSVFYFGVFLFLLAVAWAGNLLIENSGTMLMGWDYTWQFVDFAYDFWDQWRSFFATGRFPLYDSTIWIGVDNIGSNSYYSLFDPFVVVLVLFPRAWIPFLFAVTTFLKIMVSGLLMRWYLRYLGISEDASRLGGTALAFSGYMMFMVGFPTTVSACVYVPLILLGIDKVIRDRKPYCLIVGLALMGITSFFFLVVSCIWGVCYALWRYFWSIKSRNAKQNIQVIVLGVCSFLVGLMLCSWTILPSIRQSALSGRSSSIGSAYLSAILSSLKSHDLKSFFGLIFEPVGDHPSRELMGLVSFFFPTGGYLYLPLLHTGYDAWTASIFCYTPFIILFFTGVIISLKRQRWDHLIAILLCFYLLFTNFAYFFFYAFSGNGYGRWFLMLIPEIILYGCWAFDEARKEPFWVRFLGSAFSLLGTLATVLLINKLLSAESFANPHNLTYWPSNYTKPEDVVGNSNALWYIYVQAAYIVAEGVVFTAFNAKKWMPKAMLGLLCVEIIVAGNAASSNYYSIFKYSKSFMGGTENFQTAQKVASSIQSDNLPFSRTYIDQLNGSDAEVKSYNTVLGLGSSSTFHSLMNFDTEEFALLATMKSPYSSYPFKTYNDTEIFNPTWSGYYSNKRFGTDSVLGFHYYAIKNDYSNWVDFMPENVPFGSEQIYNVPAKGDANKDQYRVYKTGSDVSSMLGYAVDPSCLYQIGKKEDSYINNAFFDNSTGYSGFRNLIRAEETFLNGAIFEDDAELPSGMVYSSVPSVSTDSNLLSSYGYKALRFQSGLKGYVVTTPEGDGLFPSSGLTGSPSDAAYFFDSSKYTRSGLSTSTYAVPDRSHVVFEPSEGGYFSDDEEGCYIEFQYWNDRAPRVLVFGEKDGKANQLLTFEYGSLSLAKQAGYFNSRSGSFGLYVNGKATSICLIWPSGGSDIKVNPTNLTMYVTGKSEIMARQKKLSELSLKNVVKDNANQYSFSTSFDEDKIVVTQLGYDKGWSVKAKNEDGSIVSCPVYKLNGGLVGFLAPKGEVTYTLSYLTPYLKEGVALAVMGGSAFVGFGLYSFLKHVKKEKGEEALA